MSLTPLTNENNPLKKVKKGEINRPIIQSAFNDAPVAAVESVEEMKPVQEVKEAPVAAVKKEPVKDAAARTVSNNTNYTLVIDKDQLFLLKALSTYENKTINSVLTEALSQYFNSVNAETLKDAKALYTQISSLMKKR